MKSPLTSPPESLALPMFEPPVSEVDVFSGYYRDSACSIRHTDEIVVHVSPERFRAPIFWPGFKVDVRSGGELCNTRLVKPGNETLIGIGAVEVSPADGCSRCCQTRGSSNRHIC